MIHSPKIQVLIEHVAWSIKRAEAHDSAIDASILDIKGFSTGVMRRLFSNLAHLPVPRPVYLECGLYAGATFCAAMNNNRLLTAVGIEDFSQPFGEEGIEELLRRNIAEYHYGAENVAIFEKDCFSAPATEMLALIPPVTMLFYDAEHSEDSQARALPHFFDVMDDVFIYAVDDASWDPVQKGTFKGLQVVQSCGATVHRAWHLRGERPNDDPVWWNGVDIYVVEKGAKE